MQGLGKFRVAQVEREKDGEKTSRKRVVFTASKVKEAKKSEDKKPAGKKAKGG